MSAASEYNRLLKRQIKQSFGSEELPENVKKFVDMVHNAYSHYDVYNAQLERSMDISVKELNEKYKQLQDVNDSLDDFNHGMSHDLKTHAVNVAGLTTMLRKYYQKKNDKKVNQIFDRLEKTGEQLTSIIKGFLEVSKLENQLNSDKEHINVEEMVQDIIETLSTKIEEFNTKVHTDFSSIDNFYFSKPQLYSILYNLISNAVKYGKTDGTGKIFIYTSTDGRSSSIHIQDNGIGIDLESQKHKLFKMFSRMTKHEDIEGSGVGLFLVKKLVEKNNGSIHVESQLGKGTTFELRFKELWQSTRK